MAIYPKIQSPCPYLGNLAAIMDGDMCRACKRQVFDLTAMSDDERVAFVRGCKEEVCVTYRFPVRPLVAAAMVAAAMAVVPTAAAACDVSTVETVVETGGIKDPAHVEFIQNPGDAAIPELPVVYEAKPTLNGPAAKQPITDSNHKA